MNLERRYSDCGFQRFGKLDASEIEPRRINAKEVLISQKGDEFIFPITDGTAKLSGRDYYEFSMKVAQDIAKKLKNCGEFAANSNSGLTE